MDIPDVYHIVIVIGPVKHLNLERIKKLPGLALYRVDANTADLAHEIDMAILDHFHCWSTVVFVGGDLARQEAASCYITWLADSPSVNDDLMEFWTRVLSNTPGGVPARNTETRQK